MRTRASLSLRQSFARRLAAPALSVILIALYAHADVVSTFDAGTEGWLVSGPDPGSHIGSQQLSTTAFSWNAGFLRVGDSYGWTWAMAPVPFLGNQLGALGGTMSWDILIRFSDGVVYPAVALQGANITLYYNTPSPPIGVWHTPTVELSAPGWRVNNYASGAPATTQQLQEVLADLRGLFILTEWNTGADNTDFDNVRWPGAASCPGDLNSDQQVDDADFVIFLAAYNLLDCADPTMPPGCPADLNADNAVDDSDFVLFVRAYNELVCP